MRRGQRSQIVARATQSTRTGSKPIRRKREALDFAAARVMAANALRQQEDAILSLSDERRREEQPTKPTPNGARFVRRATFV